MTVERNEVENLLCINIFSNSWGVCGFPGTSSRLLLNIVLRTCLYDTKAPAGYAPVTSSNTCLRLTVEVSAARLILLFSFMIYDLYASSV